MQWRVPLLWLPLPLLIAILPARAGSEVPFQWSLLNLGFKPAPRFEHTMTYDSTTARIVLFGGRELGLFGDTWEWTGAEWQLKSTVGPQARWGHASAFHSGSLRTVIFGGRISESNSVEDLQDTWIWDGQSWSNPGSLGPSKRAYARMADDAARGIAVLMGGYSRQTGGYLQDTWGWDGSSWHGLGTAALGRRGFHAMAYDPRPGRQVIVLFGGTATGTSQENDTWLWDGTQWTETNLSGPRPPARFGHAMYYDVHRETIVLFGGRSTSQVFNDTWEWDGAQWSQIAAAGPSARYGHAVAGHAHTRHGLLFGGTGPEAQPASGETWRAAGAPTLTPTRTRTPTVTPTPTLTPTRTFTPTRTPTNTPHWRVLCACVGQPAPLDKDGDGLIDLYERDNGTVGVPLPNRCLADTDGDGLVDGDEDANSNGLRDPWESSPLLLDTDGDGFDDGLEFQLLRSNPADPASPGDDPADSDADRVPDVLDVCPSLPDCDGDQIDDGYELVHCGHETMLDPTRRPPLGNLDCFAGITNLDALVLHTVHLRLGECESVAGMSWADVDLDGYASNLDALILQVYFVHGGAFPMLPVRMPGAP